MYNSPKKQKISSWETQEYSHGEHRSLEHQHFRGLTPQGQHPATGRLPTWHRQDPSQDFLVGMLCSLIFTMGPIPVTPPLSPSEEQRTAIVIFPDFPPQDGESELQVAKEKQWHWDETCPISELRYERTWTWQGWDCPQALGSSKIWLQHSRPPLDWKNLFCKGQTVNSLGSVSHIRCLLYIPVFLGVIFARPSPNIQKYKQYS